MRTKEAIAAIAIALSAPAFAHPLPPGEIKPTPDMLARAERQIPRGPEPIDGKGNEYHFRNLGGRIFVCAYHWGANGGFCVRTPLSKVRQIDELAEDACRHGAEGIPHAMTGEAQALGYDCKHGHMVREPYAYHFDEDGWSTDEWAPLR